MKQGLGMSAFEGFSRGNLNGMMNIGLGTELIYSFVIIICSLMIYFGTKELYELSQHRGIKYFRTAFLFFSLAYFFRSFIKFILVYFNVNLILDIPRNFFNPFISQLTLIIFMYFSSMAIFFLLYSVICKNIKYKNIIYLFHILGITIALYSVLSRNPLSYLGLNVVLFLFILVIVLISYKDSKKKSKGHNLYFTYTLLLLFWILNIIDILIPKFFKTFQLIIYMISSGIFLFILYKVLKTVGN